MPVICVLTSVAIYLMTALACLLKFNLAKFTFFLLGQVYFILVILHGRSVKQERF